MSCSIVSSSAPSPPFRMILPMLALLNCPVTTPPTNTLKIPFTLSRTMMLSMPVVPPISRLPPTIPVAAIVTE
jgi:hypothetical protein